jgi:uncharacterized protein (TIGR02246 family)
MRVYGKPAHSADADSIKELMNRFGAAWSRGDARTVALAYAEDAEWTNAFGRVKADRLALENFLRTELFVDSTIAGTPGRSVQSRPISFRFLNENTVIIHMYSELEGQRSAKGLDMGYRRTHHTYVLGRLEEGWRIVHHMIMDQRTPVD